MEWYVTRGDSNKNNEENELKHYGIKGQQWGKRNYQYEDGSLTPEGKRRYADNKPSRANVLTTQTQTWTAKRASEIGSDLLNKIKSAVNKPTENKVDEEKLKQISDKSHDLYKLIEKIESKWESGEYFDNEKPGPIAFNKDDPLSLRSMEDNIDRIMSGYWDGYADSDMKEAKKLVAEIQELGGDPKEALSVYKRTAKPKLASFEKEIEARKPTQEEITKMRKAMNRQTKKPVSTTDR